jgi:hypothetical protein
MTVDRNKFNEMAHELLVKRDEIIDLFCKTFILSKEPKSIEEIRWIFDNFKLECKMNSPLHHEYRLIPIDLEICHER